MTFELGPNGWEAQGKTLQDSTVTNESLKSLSGFQSSWSPLVPQPWLST